MEIILKEIFFTPPLFNKPPYLYNLDWGVYYFGIYLVDNLKMIIFDL